MSFLLTFRVVREDGLELCDETVPVEHTTLEQIEKDFKLFGVRHTIRIGFDPPLTPEEDG